MDLLTKRNPPNNQELLQQRFISRILEEEAKNINIAQLELMHARNFNSADFYNERHFQTNETILRYTHLAKHRFVDMKRRLTKSGVSKKKKNHPIHNRILFGHANNIVRRLSFEYTQRTKQMLAQEFQIHL